MSGYIRILSLSLACLALFALMPESVNADPDWTKIGKSTGRAILQKLRTPHKGHYDRPTIQRQFPEGYGQRASYRQFLYRPIPNINEDRPEGSAFGDINNPFDCASGGGGTIADIANCVDEFGRSIEDIGNILTRTGAIDPTTGQRWGQFTRGAQQIGQGVGTGSVQGTIAGVKAGARGIIRAIDGYDANHDRGTRNARGQGTRGDVIDRGTAIDGTGRMGGNVRNATRIGGVRSTGAAVTGGAIAHGRTRSLREEVGLVSAPGSRAASGPSVRTASGPIVRSGSGPAGRSSRTAAARDMSDN